MARQTPQQAALGFMPPEVDFGSWAGILRAGSGNIERQRRDAVAGLRAIASHCGDVEIQRLPRFMDTPLHEGSTNPSGFFMPGRVL